MSKYSLWLLVFQLLGAALAQAPQGYYLIRNLNALSADKGQVAQFGHDCLQIQYRDPIRQSQSIETLIELIERLEENLANTTDQILSKFNTPDKVARLLLHRFHIDDVDFNTMSQEQHTEKINEINTGILQRMSDVPTTYYFPDYIFNDNEKCSLVGMFSHIYLNHTEELNRRRRATYSITRSYPNNQNQNLNNPIQSPYQLVNPIQEKGVVTFRQDRSEAIAPSRVLYGIVAAYTQNAVTDGKQILKSDDDRLTGVTIKDPVLAVTLGSLQGSAILFRSSPQLDERMVFGVTGVWQNSTCCTYYSLDGVDSKSKLVHSSRGSLAQLRGALDGYIIGNYLTKVSTKPTKLSTILKSYYSRPHLTVNDFVSYCDRGNHKPTSQDMTDVANNYKTLYSVKIEQEFDWINNGFTGALDKAAVVQDKTCNQVRPSTNMDKNSPSDTPADVIFVVDPKSQYINKTMSIIAEASGRLNRISKYSGRVSVFVNTNSRSNVELPGSSGGWPLSAWIYNSSSLGSVMCQTDTNTNLMGNDNFGKYLHYVNQTIFNYKWWTWRRYSPASASINMVLFDYDTLKVPTSGTDRDDFYYYRDSLRYRNRDVRYLVISNNQNDFKDMLRYQEDIIGHNQDYAQIGNAIATKAMETPAPITCNDCYNQDSKDVQAVGHITPGYKQNWAVYPEYFILSSNIVFRIKAVGGAIKYCYDRKFPPEEASQCKDLGAGSEGTFNYWDPCNKRTVHSCDPLYITVWGKENQGLCTDEKCESLDQIRFEIYHTGLRSSALAIFSSPVMILLSSVFYFIFKQY